MDLGDEPALAALAASLDVRFDAGEVWLDGRRVTEAIRTEACSVASSRVAAIPGVRAALLDRQRAFRQSPGLVADGRDMGSVVFPDARLKVFLTATLEARAERRYNQLNGKGIPANIQTLLLDLRERDARDAATSGGPSQGGRRRESPRHHGDDRGRGRASRVVVVSRDGQMNA